MRGRREHIAVRSYWGSPGGSLGGGNITHRRVDSVLVEHHWGLSDAGVHRPHLPSCLSACPPAAKFRHAGFRGRSSWGPGPGGDWAGPAQPRRRFEAPPRLAWLAPGRCTDWDAGWGPAGRAAATTTSATLAARFKGGSKVNAGGGGGGGLAVRDDATSMFRCGGRLSTAHDAWLLVGCWDGTPEAHAQQPAPAPGGFVEMRLMMRFVDASELQAR